MAGTNLFVIGGGVYMAGGTADALEEAQAEKQKIYQRMTEVRGLVDTALDSACGRPSA